MADENHHQEMPCALHEERIQELSKKTAELEAKNGFKQQRINELIEDNRRIEKKIDKLTETINKSILASVQGDNDLEQRVNNIETTIKTQNDTLKSYEKKLRESREEDRAKINQYIAIIGVGLTILSLLLAYIIK